MNVNVPIIDSIILKNLPSPNMPVLCQRCGWHGLLWNTAGNKSSTIPDLIVPSGSCPVCRGMVTVRQRAQ